MMAVCRLTVAGLCAITLAGCGAEATWTGAISDSTCGLYHDFDEHSGTTTEHACALMCVRQGAEFVFVSDEGHQVYAVANQSDPSLPEYAGYPVRVTARLNDRALSLSKVERLPIDRLDNTPAGRSSTGTSRSSSRKRRLRGFYGRSRS